MPSFYSTVELLTGVVDAVIVILVVHRSRQAIAKHTLRQWGEGIDRILLEEACGRGGIAFGCRYIWVTKGSELIEFVFRCKS